MNEQLRHFLIAPSFVPFRVRLNDGSVYEVPSKEHAWFGTGRSGLLFVENDSGAASVIQIRNIPPDTKMLIWDFDGTLAYRQGKWSGALVDVLDIAYPDHNFISDHFRPHVQSGFPWHHWERTNEPDLDPSLWWERLTRIFKRAYMLAANFSETEATRLAQSVRECYLNQNRWKLFDDVVPVLSLFSKRGYRQVVLSNHVPELNQLLAGLGIASFFERVFNSAVTGIEKPNPAAFLSVKAAYPEVSHFTMIGDSVTTDVSGAEAVGIPAVLVRSAGGKARRECFSLLELREQMNVGAESWNIEPWSR